MIHHLGATLSLAIVVIMRLNYSVNKRLDKLRNMV